MEEKVWTTVEMENTFYFLKLLYFLLLQESHGVSGSLMWSLSDFSFGKTLTSH